MSSAPTTPKDIAGKIRAGKQLSKKDQKFYEENHDQVEKELVVLSEKETPATTSTQSGGSTSFNPLAESVNEKNYTGQESGGASNVGAGAHIPEHRYESAPEEPIIPEREKTEKEKERDQKPKEPANPDLAGASDKEKTQGAEQLAEVIFTTMSQLYGGVNKLIMISEKTLNKKQQSGEINTRVEVPYKTGYAPISRVFKEYNEDASTLLTVEEEWKDAVRPALVEELSKAGHGMSNKQFLIYMFTVKLANDGYKTAQFLSLKKDYLTFAKEQTIIDRKRGRSNQNTPPPETVHEQEQEEQVEESGSGGTLQEKAIAKHFPQNMQAPRFGSQDKLDKLNRAERNDKNTVKKEARQHIEKAKKKTSAILRNDPPPDGVKRKKGRPPGSLNKKKK